MKLLKSLISKYFSGPKKGVGINIDPESGLEIVEYDSNLGEILNYFQTEFPYDSLNREINIDNFEKVLQNLVRRFDVSSQTPVVLTMPSIFINKKELPMELQADEVSTALVSETEKNYIFKKTEPKISFEFVSTNKDRQTNTYLYSALQKNVLDGIEDVFKRQDIKLTAVETSYAALIRGISAAGLLDDYIENNTSWCAMIIKNNSNAVITLKGNKVNNILESPLALKSLDADDLYSALSSNLVEKIDETEVDSMLIVNYSREIDIDNLITYFSFKCPVIKVENDYFNGTPLFKYQADPNNKYVSAEVIGSACWKSAPVKFGFNFIGSSGKDEGGFLSSIGLSGNPIHIYLFAAIALSTIVITALTVIFMSVNGFFESKNIEMSAQCNKYKAKFSQPVQKVFNLYDTVQEGFTNNAKFIDSFNALGSVIPEKVWITSVAVDSGLNTEVKGNAYNIEDIVAYYKNLLTVSKFNNLKIKSIKVVGEADSNSNSSNSNTPTSVNINPPPLSPPSSGAAPALPPPPSIAGQDISSNTTPSSPSQKYYEFIFGNPSEEPKTSATTQSESNSLIPNLDNIAKGFNLGKK